MIKAPNWCPDAYPSVRGWERDGELLASCKHTPAQVAEWTAANRETGHQLLNEVPTQPNTPSLWGRLTEGFKD